MRGVGPFSPQLKLFLTIGTCVLTVLAVIALISHLASGGHDWPYYSLVVAVSASMIFMVRRTATTEGDRR